ncbi:MAG TPA: glycerophosphodiester phosphodiesterase [Candidatus Saccharimonadales bacterium]
MTQTGIIGHRGAAGLALENSHDSLRAALELSMDGIEFDVRKTKDDRLVVMHDTHTGRIAKQKVLVSMKTLAELQAITLYNGQHILSFEEVCKLIGDRMMMVIDIKDNGSADEILRVLKQFPKAKVSFTSLKYGELQKLREMLPDVPIYVRDILNPFEVVHTARRMHATGITLNMWLMNPLTYWLAKRRHLNVFVYTVNNVWLYRLLRTVYPGIVVCSDHPQRFVKRSGQQQAKPA